ncbi:hypothetical protein DUNSADRAFT_2506 [Dunaliella salina]|uniref:Encoded protein n=1 Tax=Dunaliella salina TaxID=3046 RepID=A0ABQ7GVF7_DUNSA|nr:hypothetical protein DUNSADRAFT_2506 [Dunaliella salina]|eukprot:KAF5838597.1 hypothetical protein DUNSADRAFT_2506 [Dunaliella salina]
MYALQLALEEHVRPLCKRTCRTWNASNCVLRDWSLRSIITIIRCSTSLTKRTITFTYLRSSSSIMATYLEDVECLKLYAP